MQNVMFSFIIVMSKHVHIFFVISYIIITIMCY